MSRRGLLGIRRFVISSHVLDTSLNFLREVGLKKMEGVAAWGGEREGADTFSFRAAYVPRQTAIATEDGLSWQVDDDALHELNVAFNDAGLTLAGQVHSHPTSAYHSDTDDRSPLVTLLGAISVVVPDFAAGGLSDLDRFAWFRLHGFADWRPVGSDIQIELG